MKTSLTIRLSLNDLAKIYRYYTSLGIFLPTRNSLVQRIISDMAAIVGGPNINDSDSIEILGPLLKKGGDDVSLEVAKRAEELEQLAKLKEGEPKNEGESNGRD